MSDLHFWFVLACAPALLAAEPTPAPRTIDDFTLRDVSGKQITLSELKSPKFVVVAFLGAECPLAKLYGPRLAKLYADYHARGIAFLGINSNAQDSISEVADYARLHKLEFPLLKDPGNVVADLFAAKRTPVVYVLDAERVVRYCGRIDDQYSVGEKLPEPKVQDLRQALDDLLAGKPVGKPQTDPVGCLIGRCRKPDEKCTVTYSNQIARILNDRCVVCHRTGEIGPFSMTDYREVAPWSEMIAEVISDGRMPPWHADPTIGKFEGDRHLSDEEKKLILDWAKAGAPEGDRVQMPEAPHHVVSDWQLPREPDSVVPMRGTPFTVPAEGIVPYQFFVVDPGYSEDKWVNSIQLIPGNHAVVHHATVFAFQNDVYQALKDGTTDGYLAVYVPGMQPAAYPKGMAKRIAAGSKLVFQVHYAPNGSEQVDCSKLGLNFVDPKEVEYEVITGSVVQRTFVIPPNAASHRVVATSIRAPRESRLLGMMPHMHGRGASFKFEVLFPDRKLETLLDVPHYDYNWQTSYRLVEPRTLPAGTQLRCTAYFDNSETNRSNPDPTKAVRFGIQSQEEMMVGYFDVAVRRDTAAPPTADTKKPVKNAKAPRRG